MTIVFKNASCSPGYSSSSVTISAPAGTENGDFLICYVSHQYPQAVISTPSGWNTIYSTAHEHGSLNVSYRIAQTGDTSWSWTNGVRDWYGCICRYNGVDITNPIHNKAETYTTNGIIAPSVSYTNLTDGGVAIMGMGSSLAAYPDLSIPSGLTGRFGGNHQYTTTKGGDKYVSGTGSTGSASFCSFNAGTGVSVILNPDEFVPQISIL